MGELVARNGCHELTNLMLTSAQVTELVERVLKSSGRRVDLSQPFLDAMLPEGHRLHVVLEGISRGFSAANIRKFVLRASRASDLVELGSMSARAAAFLEASVRAGLNILVAGGTQTGKTTPPQLVEEACVFTAEDADDSGRLRQGELRSVPWLGGERRDAGNIEPVGPPRRVVRLGGGRGRAGTRRCVHGLALLTASVPRPRSVLAHRAGPPSLSRAWLNHAVRRRRAQPLRCKLDAHVNGQMRKSPSRDPQLDPGPAAPPGQFGTARIKYLAARDDEGRPEMTQEQAADIARILGPTVRERLCRLAILGGAGVAISWGQGLEGRLKKGRIRNDEGILAIPRKRGSGLRVRKEPTVIRTNAREDRGCRSRRIKSSQSGAVDGSRFG
ncbi:ATPase, T2SS/T4P/T4SS family [Nocardioides pantholopis]|uniref:ATPase, T2SS/T4P/T4SS family n=1 Tax=Nocardioides pantholopis TaxID=2483798 RepID=UPI001F15337D|nr:ATPase, T2SS/T4P/T4SS family [Nocardioides pantholopis]